jgi:hypothetical protein
MSVFSLSRAILMMNMLAGYMAGDANVGEGVQFLVFTTSIGLHGYYFPIKHLFHKLLKLMELLKHFGFELQSVNPCKFAIIINEANEVFLATNRVGHRSLNI